MQLPEGQVMTLQYDQVSRDFHRTIVEASGSQRLLSTFDDLYNDVRRLQYAGIGTPRPDLIHEEHVEILKALEARDPQLAAERMTEHIDNVKSRALTAWVSAGS